MTQTLQALRGMNDILPDEADLWLEFEEIVRTWLHRYGYRNIRTPLLEHTVLFRRSIGEATDIVEKEMYSFTDELNGEQLTLRPEATASTVRAAIEHNLIYNGPQRLWYVGPMFRHERPQKGRYRQFHQVGAEALGFSGPDVDAELLVMCARLWRDLGLEHITLSLNSLGSLPERQRHREALVEFLRKHEADLDGDSKRRLTTNPLRVLDSKVPQTQAIVAQAPRLFDFLGDESLQHFDGVRRLLEQSGIEYAIDHRLVRGLDYYNRTVFEWVTNQLGAQGTVCGRGRYDGLFEQIGGKPAPAAGFAMGVERLLELMRASKRVARIAMPDVYVVHQGDEAARYAFSLSETLRSAGYAVVLHGGGGGFKSQMKKADGSKAVVAVIVGDDEVAAQAATIKTLRRDMPQQRVALADVAATVGELLQPRGQG